MKDEFITRVGVWGQRHYNFLKKNTPTVINVMRLNGTLEQYLTDLDRDAQDMFGLLMKQYTEVEGITEHLKLTNQMEWVRQISNIRNRVTEIVCKELIYI
ncbi:MAG: TnpV protein [Oscillospiraceae bacterium]|nr:MAG: TnpV protein [Oscillospiraceae bacterium]